MDQGDIGLANLVAVLTCHAIYRAVSAAPLIPHTPMPSPEERLKAMHKRRKREWQCPKCKKINRPQAVYCGFCLTNKEETRRQNEKPSTDIR